MYASKREIAEVQGRFRALDLKLARAAGSHDRHVFHLSGATMRGYRPLTTTLLPLLLLSSTAAADDAALLHCRTITDALARLACYDALPVAGAEAKAAPEQAATARKSAQELFGMEAAIAPPAGLPAIETSIPGHFEGWGPDSRFRLANGQIWQVADGSSRIYDVDNPKVTIARGMLGAFYLSLVGDNRTVRVRRIQ
jgi:hypothetical protein